MSEKKFRLPNTKEAVIILLAVIAIILVCINITLELVPALALGAAVAAIGATYLGASWKEINSGMIDGIVHGLEAVIIMVVIGMIIGTWILSGAIPTLISYGLNILTPGIFLPAGFILCSLVSVLVGTSLGTIATMGVVLMGVGQGLGVPAEMTAAVVISGSVFGDKISPMSDSTNVTAAVSGTPLFSHVGSMLFVSGPAVIVSIVIYYFLGRNQLTQTADLEVVDQIISTLHSSFTISPLTLIPAVVVMVLLMMKVPAVPALMGSFVTASITAILVQGSSLEEVLVAAGSGYSADTGYELIDGLLSQGGVSSMMGTIMIVIVASAMGGILESSGVLSVILESVMKVVKKPSMLILATLAGGYLMMLATGEMMVSIILVGRTLQPAYDKLGVHRSVMSRSLETSCTLPAGVLPWGVVAVYARGVLNVGFGYVRYCYLPFLALAFAILWAVLGLFTFAADENDYEAPVKFSKTL